MVEKKTGELYQSSENLPTSTNTSAERQHQKETYIRVQYQSMNIAHTRKFTSRVKTYKFTVFLLITYVRIQCTGSKACDVIK